jgi:hypothetical protein
LVRSTHTLSRILTPAEVDALHLHHDQAIVLAVVLGDRAAARSSPCASVI